MARWTMRQDKAGGLGGGRRARALLVQRLQPRHGVQIEDGDGVGALLRDVDVGELPPHLAHAARGLPPDHGPHDHHQQQQAPAGTCRGQPRGNGSAPRRRPSTGVRRRAQAATPAPSGRAKSRPPHTHSQQAHITLHHYLSVAACPLPLLHTHFAIRVASTGYQAYALASARRRLLAKG